MALKTAPLKRRFVYMGRVLPDLPGMSIEDVKGHYVTEYPELSTVTVVGPENVGTALQYTFTRAVGSKG